MKVATPTKDCLELVLDLLVPVVKARGEKTLNRQEVNPFNNLFTNCLYSIKRSVIQGFNVRLQVCADGWNVQV